jgi:membrane-associated protein
MEFIENIMQMIQNNVEMAPYISFGLLLLAGFNIPVSEDALLFINAILAAKNPDQKYMLFGGVFLGAYISDLICYWLGRTLGPKLWKIKFFANMVDPKLVDKLSGFYNKYGMMTLIVGRFIPFGVRNGLFLTAGLSKMDAKKFAFSDLIATTITCSIFFTLYFHYGESVIEFVKKFNIIIFSIAAIASLTYFIVKKRQKTSNQPL